MRRIRDGRPRYEPLFPRIRFKETGSPYAVILSILHTNVIRTSLLAVTSLQISPERMLVQFGFAKHELTELAERLTPVSTTGTELEVTFDELRMIYLGLRQVPDMYGSEEHFHERLGFFSEQAIHLARSLLTAMDRVA